MKNRNLLACLISYGLAIVFITAAVAMPGGLYGAFLTIGIFALVTSLMLALGIWSAVALANEDRVNVQMNRIESIVREIHRDQSTALAIKRTNAAPATKEQLQERGAEKT